MTVLDQKSLMTDVKKNQPQSKDLLSPETLASLHNGAIDDTLNNGHRQTLLDHVIFGLLGTPDSMLSAPELKARQGRRAAASQDANQAMNAPGDEFMSPPNAGGSGGGIGNILSTVMKLVGAIA